MSLEYDRYLSNHIENVRKGYQWLSEHLPNTCKYVPIKLIAEHDQSKYMDDEYKSYDAYFYGGNKSYRVVEDFNEAWLFHIHRNPHHWQYWVLINDDQDKGEIIMDMPHKYIIEMICDWWSFSWKSGNLYEIFDWYDERKDYIKLSVRTSAVVKGVLDGMKQKLDELEIVNDG